MKLLSPQQNRASKEAENVREMARTQEIQKAAQKARLELSKAEADFKENLSKFKEVWALEEKNHSDRIKEMSKEVDQLEKRKQQALIPISIYKESANKVMQEARQLYDEARQKDEEIAKLREKLEDKLDAVGEREQDMAELGQKLALQRVSIENEGIILAEKTKGLNEQIVAFLAKAESREKELKDRETKIVLQEQTIKAERDSLKRTEKGLEEWAIRLADERGTLERERKRMKSA
jgi:predicted  nucleic acid-binding Zn-ribbon protein